MENKLYLIIQECNKQVQSQTQEVPCFTAYWSLSCSLSNSGPQRKQKSLLIFSIRHYYLIL